MSGTQLIKAMDNLHLLHKSLLDLSRQKTEILKAGDVEALKSVLKDEQKHVSAINKFELERQKLVREILLPNGISEEEFTISKCLDYVSEEEAKQLDLIKLSLIEVMGELKERNLLNSQLIEQSLHLVHVTLDMVNPEPQSINYGPPSKSESSHNRSFFNHKA